MATALITGASTGIGRELSTLCAAAGMDVVLVARNEAQLSALAASLPRNARIVVKDLLLPEAPREVFDAVRDLEIDVLINNAAVGMLGYFHELDAEGQRRMLELNVNALTHLTRLFVPGMVQRGRGRILNVASTAAFQAGPLMAIYYASKAYVLSLSEALADELADKGVSVTCLCPGPTRTDFEKRANAQTARLFRGPNVMDAAAVAKAGFDGMMAGDRLVIPGALNRALAFLTRFAPRRMAASIARRLQETK